MPKDGAVLPVRYVVGIFVILVVLMAGAHAAPAGPPADEDMPAFALRWFAQIQAGKIDRAQYAASYGVQLTEEAVRAMSQHLNQYGASPIRAEVMKKRVIEAQTFYLMKFAFARGDATSLLFGFDTEGKVTGIAIESMAGD